MPKPDPKIPVSRMPIYLPARAYFREGSPDPVLTPPAIFFDDEARARYLRFAREVSTKWSADDAKRRTPKLLRPDGFQLTSVPIDHEREARETYRDIAVPQFQAEMIARPVGLSQPGGCVLQRWWRRRLARQRNLDLATLLRDARASHRWLQKNFGAMRGRKGSKRSPEFEHERRARAAGEQVDDRPAQEWRRLARAVHRLVAFDRWYVETAAARFAVRFATRTDMGGDFLDRYGRAAAEKGIDSGKAKIDGVRWELCLRVWTYYATSMSVDWSWKRMRLLQRNVIWNFELMQRGHRAEGAGPESITTWLKRNGW